MYAVLDGHGGPSAARLAARRLVPHIAQCLERAPVPAPNPNACLQAADAHGRVPPATATMWALEDSLMAALPQVSSCHPFARYPTSDQNHHLLVCSSLILYLAHSPRAPTIRTLSLILCRAHKGMYVVIRPERRSVHLQGRAQSPEC